MNQTATEIVQQTPAGTIIAILNSYRNPAIDIHVNGIHAGIFEYNPTTNRFCFIATSEDLDYCKEPISLSRFPETINFMGYNYPCRYLDVPIKVEDEIEIHTYTIITPALDDLIQGLIEDEDPEGLDWLSEKYWVAEDQSFTDEEIIKQIQSKNSD